jgi:rhodanese-related sulfurtransferase
MKYLIILLIISLAVLALVAYVANESEDLQTNVFYRGYTSLSVMESKKLIEEKPESTFIVLDVRTPEEFVEGHLSNAVNIDFNAPDFKAKVNELDKQKTYLVYCRSGRRSLEAAKVMKAAGFNSVINMKGGILAWESAGNDVCKLPYC